MYKYYLPTAIKVETSDNPSIVELSELMSGISESLTCAGWTGGTENLVWDLLEGKFVPHNKITEEYLSTIRELREGLNGWIVFLDDSIYSREELPVHDWGLYFVSMKEWMKGINNFGI